MPVDKNPIDFSASRSKGGPGGSGLPSWFPRSKFSTVSAEIIMARNPLILVHVSQTRRGGGAGGSLTLLYGFLALCMEPFAIECLHFTG